MKCLICGAMFEPYRPNHKYCSAKCYRRGYYVEHKAESYRAHRDWYIAHKEEMREYNRQYYIKNREKLLFKQKVYQVTGEWPKGEAYA